VSYAIGEPVRTVAWDPSGHCRLPQYLRGKPCTIELIHGLYRLADTNAMGKAGPPELLYTVRFNERAVWGPYAEGDGVLFADLWESHLEQR
jgi:nitrile hydratase subunit beta